MSQTYVTRPFLPPLAEFQDYVTRIWQSGQLTNQGPLVREFEQHLKDYLGLEAGHLHFVGNGTLGLQLALRSLDITSGEVITTPFSYVATVSSILWERCTPVFVDIDPQSLCIAPELIEAAITPQTRAILPVHVFGNAADVTAIAETAQRHGLPVIYDGAHAFGSQLNGRSLLGYGDVAVTSFHATKAFHTIEGGAVITNCESAHAKLELLKRFGHDSDDHIMLGINGKATEFSAAMGLANLRHVDSITARRQALAQLYDQLMDGRFGRQRLADGLRSNHAYYPILLSDEPELLAAQRRLNAIDVVPRRYFYPALNTLPYLANVQTCEVAEDVARRILCLPLYPDLDEGTVEKIVRVLVDG